MLEMTRAKELLEEKMNSCFPGEYGAKARASYAKLKVFTAGCTVAAEAGCYETARMYLKGKGDLLEAQPEAYLLAMTGSGRNDQNPTVVELVVEGGELTVTAWAKEGIFRQKSAEKAVAACLEALRLA